MISFKDDFKTIRRVAGLDVSYFKALDTMCGVAAAVLLEYPSLRPLKYGYASGPPPIPYVPGLLAFREAPLLFKACGPVCGEADILIVDGHGASHPRGLGIASHIGLVLDKPSIGVAKKRLAGGIVEKDGVRYLAVRGRVVGVVLESRGKPLYVSTGHKISPRTAGRLAEKMIRRGYLPEPTRIADALSHRLVSEFRSSHCSHRSGEAPF